MKEEGKEQKRKKNEETEIETQLDMASILRSLGIYVMSAVRSGPSCTP